MIAAAILVSAPGLARAPLAQAGKPAQPKAIVEKPKRVEVAGGWCRMLDDGTLSAHWGPDQLPTLAFTIGPKAAMATEMHANKTKFRGAGRYDNEILAVYLGKTALEESYGGLGTVVFSPDGHSGSFATNDGKASGHFECGGPPIEYR